MKISQNPKPESTEKFDWIGFVLLIALLIMMGGCMKHQKPKLERFGTLRELTLSGLGQDGDGGIQGRSRLIANAQNPNRS